MSDMIIYSHNIQDFNNLEDGKKMLLSNKRLPADIQEKFDFYIYTKEINDSISFIKNDMNVLINDLSFNYYKNSISFCKTFGYKNIFIKNNNISTYKIDTSFDFSDIDYITILPIKKSDKFVIFASFNEQINNRTLIIKIHENDRYVGGEVVKINSNMTYLKKMKFSPYKIIVEIIENEIIIMEKIFDFNDIISIYENGFIEEKELFEFDLTDRILIKSKSNIDNTKIYVWNLNEEFIFYGESDFKENVQMWFLPDNKTYIDGCTIEIKKGDDLLARKIVFNKDKNIDW